MRSHFQKRSTFPVSARTLWAFHERPDAFELLSPPWRRMQVIEPPRSLEVGTRVVARTRIGPLWQKIMAEHVEYEAGRMFADRMLRGPFSYWLHRHIVTPLGPRESELLDDVEYELPGGPLGRLFGGGFARRELERLFEYRHQKTREVCLAMR